MTSAYIIAAAGAFALVVSACTESEALSGPGGKAGRGTGSVAGTYDIDLEATVDAMLAAMPSAATKTDEEKAAMFGSLKGFVEGGVFKIEGDLSWSCANINERAMKGSYVISDGAITLTSSHVNGKEKKTTHSGTIRDGKLTLSIRNDGDSMRMYFVRME